MTRQEEKRRKSKGTRGNDGSGTTELASQKCKTSPDQQLSRDGRTSKTKKVRKASGRRQHPSDDTTGSTGYRNKRAQEDLSDEANEDGNDLSGIDNSENLPGAVQVASSRNQHNERSDIENHSDNGNGSLSDVHSERAFEDESAILVVAELAPEAEDLELIRKEMDLLQQRLHDGDGLVVEEARIVEAPFYARKIFAALALVIVVFLTIAIAVSVSQVKKQNRMVITQAPTAAVPDIYAIPDSQECLSIEAAQGPRNAIDNVTVYGFILDLQFYFDNHDGNRDVESGMSEKELMSLFQKQIAPLVARCNKTSEPSGTIVVLRDRRLVTRGLEQEIFPQQGARLLSNNSQTNNSDIQQDDQDTPDFVQIVNVEFRSLSLKVGKICQVKTTSEDLFCVPSSTEMLAFVRGEDESQRLSIADIEGPLEDALTTLEQGGMSSTGDEQSSRLPLGKVELIHMYEISVYECPEPPTNIPVTETPSAAPTAASDMPSDIPSQTPTGGGNRSRPPHGDDDDAGDDDDDDDATTITTSRPSAWPSSRPSATPSTFPSAKPSQQPSSQPSLSPSALPSLSPSAIPSLSPSSIPSSMPSAAPKPGVALVSVPCF